MREQRIHTWEGREVEHWAQDWRVPELHVLERTGSTNDVAKRLATAGAPSGTTVIAELQEAGRGRLGRRWLAPHGKALLMSMVLRNQTKRDSAHGTAPIRAGLATAFAIEQVTQSRVLLKWPNDVLLRDGRKVAGILCEASVGDSTDYVVVGIGINVNQTEEDFPPELGGEGASLAMAAGHPVARASLAGALAEALRAAGANGITRVLDAHELEGYRRRDALRGVPVLVDSEPAGTALGINRQGALLLDRPGALPVTTATVRVADPSAPPRIGGEPDAHRIRRG